MCQNSIHSSNTRTLNQACKWWGESGGHSQRIPSEDQRRWTGMRRKSEVNSDAFSMVARDLGTHWGLQAPQTPGQKATEVKTERCLFKVKFSTVMFNQQGTSSRLPLAPLLWLLAPLPRSCGPWSCLGKHFFFCLFLFALFQWCLGLLFSLKPESESFS